MDTKQNQVVSKILRKISAVLSWKNAVSGFVIGLGLLELVQGLLELVELLLRFQANPELLSSPLSELVGLEGQRSLYCPGSWKMFSLALLGLASHFLSCHSRASYTSGTASLASLSHAIKAVLCQFRDSALYEFFDQLGQSFYQDLLPK